MKTTLRFLCFFAGLILSACSSGSSELPASLSAVSSKVPAEIDYNLHVKPILSDRCFKCHGPDKNKVEAGLQLINFEGANASLKSGKRAVVPNDIAASELVKRILSHDPEDMMPTPKSNLSLSDIEKAILVKWIQQGGEYKEHWAFTKISEPSLPKIGTFWSRLGLSSNPETDWAKDGIDAFTLSMAKTEGLKPNKEADKATLLRRVSMDLTGLPPTPAEVDAFLANTAPDAYEKAVDRLLKSPHFGEHQAVSWLDAARYADTQGYQDDGMRNAFPYRDWVISAFNQNLSFDKFTKYQLAGDLLPNPSQDMLVATSFNRQHQQSQEGGIVPQEYQVEYVADRVNTFGKTFLGLTTECARCHDHKYDPILAKDYYSLFAFFNTNNEHGQIPYNGEPSPHITIPKPESAAKLNSIKQYLNKLESIDEVALKNRFEMWLSNAKKAAKKPILADSAGLVFKCNFEKIEKRTVVENIKIPADSKKKIKEHFEKKKKDEVFVANSAQDGRPFYVNGDEADYPKPIKGKFGNGFYLPGSSHMEVALKKQVWDGQENHETLKNTATFDRFDAFSISLWVNIEKNTMLGSVINRHLGPMNGNRGYQITRLENGHLTFRLANSWPDDAIEVEANQVIPLKTWVNVAVTYDGSSKAAGVCFYINGRPVKTILHTDNLCQSAVYGKHFSGWGSGAPNLSIGMSHDQYNKNYAVDELFIYKRKLSALEIDGLVFQKNNLAAIFNKNSLTETEKNGLFDYYKTNFDPAYRQYLSARTQKMKEETYLLNEETVDVAIMHEQTTPRTSFLLKRGAYDAPGEVVTPATPVKFGEMPSSFPRNRLGLAEWLLDEANPLFARVMVNRFWQNFFGVGLVKTQEDFGNQGDMPTNPQLLDWLSVQFRASNWDVKAFQKLIVMSATYRQSSIVSQEMMERDLENKYLMRGPSYRFAAEQVRDNALAASGLLTRKIGGRSVYPYQPAGIWEALATRNAVTYQQNHSDSLYRRSMYTIWKRSSPPPMMLNFDAAERHSCVVRRQKTATPLQALVTMNDPQFVEAAKVLAENAMLTSKSERKAGIQYIFKAALSRPARPNELVLMMELYEAELQDFQKDKSRANSLLTTGDRPSNKSLNQEQLAALTVVANTILNYDEAIVKR